MVKKTALVFFSMIFSTAIWSDIAQNIDSKNYEAVFQEMKALIDKDISIIELYPNYLPYFDKKKYPELFDFLLKKTNQLLEKYYYKESLKFYKLLTLYEKNDKELYENYKRAYVFYTNKVIDIKKALTNFKEGNIGQAKLRLKELEKDIPKESNLFGTVILGYKEIERRVYEEYVVPGIKRIDDYLDKRMFSESRGDLFLLKKYMPVSLLKETQEKIMKTEKQYYFGTAEENFIQKKYGEALALMDILIQVYPDDPEVAKKMLFYKEEKLKAELQSEAYNNLKQGDSFYNARQYPSALYYYKAYLTIVKRDKDIEKRIKQIEGYLEEEKKRRIFYESFNSAMDLYKAKNYEKAYQIFFKLKDNLYEQEKTEKLLNEIQKELERIRIENEKELAAKNYLNEGYQNFNSLKYKESLDAFVLAYSNLEEISGREKLKEEAKRQIQRARNMIKEVEQKNSLARIKKINEGVARGKSEYLLGNYEKSIIYFQQALSLDPDNVIAQNYQDLALEAQKTQSVGKIFPNEPFYPVFISLKKSGVELQQEGIDFYNKGNKKKGRELLEESLNKWQTIKRAYPYNEDARKNVRMIFKILNPEQWKAVLAEDLKKAMELMQANNKTAAYMLIKEIYEEAPNFPGIKKFITQAKPEEKKTTLTQEEKMGVNDSYNRALSAFTRREYKEALKITSGILNQNKTINDDIIEKVKSLYLKIKNRLESENLDSLNLDMNQVVQRTKLYRQALSFYQKGDYRQAINFARQALKIDPNYAGALSLVDAAKKRLNL